MIIHGDILEWAASYQGPKVHALLCDPPYELGFMGKHWDKSGIVFDPATWAALGGHMHSGAFGMAFASSRGWHRLACAIEDAGMAIHPSVFGWGFGSGFPKATRISGAEAFAGHRYGMQCLKPAIEPVIVFQKPYAGKPVECIVETGAGALWVDGGRIGTERPPTTAKDFAAWRRAEGRTDLQEAKPDIDTNKGRWPANFALIHSPECNGECAPECAVRRLGEQSGELKSGDIAPYRREKASINVDFMRGTSQSTAARAASTGTAARYFFQAQWDQLDAADPVKYQAKASRRERDAGLDGLPLKQYSHDGRQTPIENPYQRNNSVSRNPHPTVKPIALIEHLATLLLPPAEYAPRRIMIPFAGSGSEMIGATLAGWDEVVGIEREAEYVEIAEKRLAYWQEKRQNKAKEADSQMSLLEAVG